LEFKALKAVAVFTVARTMTMLPAMVVEIVVDIGRDTTIQWSFRLIGDLVR
jgi:hypothetical protein